MVWVRKSIEEGKYREIRSVELSIKASFIAKHGNLDDLTFLERIGTEVPMDSPKYLRIIERRKRELSAPAPANSLENPSNKSAKSLPIHEASFAKNPKKGLSEPDEAEAESGLGEKSVPTWKQVKVFIPFFL